MTDSEYINQLEQELTGLRKRVSVFIKEMDKTLFTTKNAISVVEVYKDFVPYIEERSDTF